MREGMTKQITQIMVSRMQIHGSPVPTIQAPRDWNQFEIFKSTLHNG